MTPPTKTRIIVRKTTIHKTKNKNNTTPTQQQEEKKKERKKERKKGKKGKQGKKGKVRKEERRERRERKERKERMEGRKKETKKKKNRERKERRKEGKERQERKERKEKKGKKRKEDWEGKHWIFCAASLSLKHLYPTLKAPHSNLEAAATQRPKPAVSQAWSLPLGGWKAPQALCLGAPNFCCDSNTKAKDLLWLCLRVGCDFSFFKTLLTAATATWASAQPAPSLGLWLFACKWRAGGCGPLGWAWALPGTSHGSEEATLTKSALH